MRRRVSSSESGSHKDTNNSADVIENIRTKPPHIYDNVTRKLLQFGTTLAVTTLIGLIVRYAVQEFDPSVSTITVTTSRIDNRDVASLSVSKNFLERILEFIGESIAIVGAVIPIGFPLCTIFNKYFAKLRAGSEKFLIKNDKVLGMIPKYVVIGDAQACQMPETNRLRPLVRDTIYYLIKSRFKPKLICEESYEDARKLGIRIGLIKRDHHKLAVIKSVDLLKSICDSRGDIKQGKVRYLLSRMKIMSQSTPADKSLLIYLIKHCESLPNENLAYLGQSFTDPEAMKIADCSMSFEDCDDDDVKKTANVILKSESVSFSDVYLFVVVCLIASNVTQSYALYQISASVSSSIYRFLSITVFKEQLVSHSQFGLIVMIQQLFAIIAMMTKWISSLPQTPLRGPVGELSHSTTDDSYAGDPSATATRHKRASDRRSNTSASGNGADSGSSVQRTSSRERQSVDGVEGAPVHEGRETIPLHKMNADDTLGSSSLEEYGIAQNNTNTTNVGAGAETGTGSGQARSSEIYYETDNRAERPHSRRSHLRSGSNSQLSTPHRQRKRVAPSEQPVRLSGLDLDKAVINSKIATNYKQTFHYTTFIDDVTYRLAKLHIAYQILVMIIIMIFGNAMFQLNTNNARQHQTLALNSLIMNNIFNLANCFNQFGAFNLRSGFKNHPFFVCALLISVATQVCLTELNAFGLENLNPTQWFVCFVFALLSALIAPLTGQQRNQRKVGAAASAHANQTANLGGANLVFRSASVTPVSHNRHPPSNSASRPSLTPAKMSPTTNKYADVDGEQSEDSY